MGCAEVNRQVFFHGLVDGKRFIEILSREGAAARDHGKAVGTGVLVHFGRFHDGLFVKKIVFFTACVMAGSLGAVFAVFAAASASSIDDGAEINMVAAKMAL